MREGAYKHYLLVVLLVTLAFNYVDRMALGLLMQDIKLDLHLTDTQLGVLSGIAFALFYSLMGIPIARWADRGNRVTIIATTALLWSVAVTLCSLAGSFLQLLLIRVAVAVGEAGCVPPAHSLIADYFKRSERPRAVAIYMLGGPLSLLIGYFLAGWLNQFYGWRTTFMLLGLPGLALALLAWLTLREPRIGARLRDDGDARQPSPPSLTHVCVTLWSNRTFRHLLLGFAVAYFFGYGIGQWKAAFFVRSYGLDTGELGTWFAVIYGIGGIVGTFWGGYLASHRAAGNEALQLRAMGTMYVVLSVVSICIYIAPNEYMAFGFMALAAVGVTTVNGPLFATIQTLVPPGMRAISIALIYLFANLIGMGLGPLAAGVLSDVLAPWVGAESLRYSLLALCPGYIWCGWHLLRASKTVMRDLQAVRMQVEPAVPGSEGGAAHDAFLSQRRERA